MVSGQLAQYGLRTIADTMIDNDVRDFDRRRAVQDASPAVVVHAWLKRGCTSVCESNSRSLVFSVQLAAPERIAKRIGCCWLDS
jgi:hypothetical protein